MSNRISLKSQIVFAKRGVMVGMFNFGKNGAEKVYYILPIFRIIAENLLNSRDARRVRPHVLVGGCAGLGDNIVVGSI